MRVDKSFYVNNYVKLAWMVLSDSHGNNCKKSLRKFHEFNNKYGTFINQLIYNSQLSPTNLVISIYYLNRYYHHNDVLNLEQNDEEDGDNMTVYLIIMSLILSNKSFDDQSYTLKTWLTIISSTISNTNQSEDLVRVDLPLLNYLESYFLSCLNYKLSFNNLAVDSGFWSKLTNSSMFKLSRAIIQNLKSLVQEEDLSWSPSSPTSNYNATPISTPVDEKISILSTVSAPLVVPTSATFRFKPVDYRTPSLSSFSSPSFTKAPTACSSNRMSKGIYSPLTPLTPYSDEQNYYASSIKRRKLNQLGSCQSWVQQQQQQLQQQHLQRQQQHILLAGQENPLALPAVPLFFNAQLPYAANQFNQTAPYNLQQNIFWS
ncbi:hypothetical protein PICST_66459 [Scheffersomyces stipitis CBS 6054]|uniref:Uncharacterized protein n=1 Tax=Scheffersomyces stipitis (strain ATCC 58785 / CBS 6054 / NBRC 10063 / NRRL Y-11545) TaxID=322104 RepID=A3GGF6_PICST|nr:hypothetical protein PICST_66459 [Scheffersomyces stipitis CBS 6054]EAZ63924.2 hypothetical protein PICST_66459 [Scheffersomyces stipitis CBS 6054]KAG2735573.1 hypothetical protein G9P44_001787 [Scheffersomyces stipitis]